MGALVGKSGILPRQQQQDIRPSVGSVGLLRSQAVKPAQEAISFGSQNLAEGSKLGESGRLRGLQTAGKKTLRCSQDPQLPALQFVLGER